MTSRRTARACLAVLLALAPQGRAFAEVKNPDTLVYLLSSDWDTLDPHLAVTSAANNQLLNIYESLMTFRDGTMTELVPLLAAAVPTLANRGISPDGRTYRFTIRKGVRFQDGSPLTPEDVKYSILRATLLDPAAGVNDQIRPLLGLSSTRDDSGKLRPGLVRRAEEAVRVEGDDVVFRLPKPYVPFLFLIENISIVSKPWCVQHGGWDGTEAMLAKANNPAFQDSYLHDHADGTGPFALERWDKALRQLVLIRHDNYWRGPARLKRVIVKVVPDRTTQKQLLQNGDADMTETGSLDAPSFEGAPGVRLLDRATPLRRGPIVFFNFKIDVKANHDVGSGALDGEGIPADFFADKDVRLGFAHLIDSETFLREALRGKGKPATGFIPPGIPGHSAEGFRRSFDPTAAAGHFRKAFGGRVWERGFHLTIPTAEGNSQKMALVQILKKQVEALNPKFRIDLRTIQNSTLWDATRHGKIPLALVGWGVGLPDPQPFVEAFLSGHGPIQTGMGYSNGEADRLIDEAAVTIDPKRREETVLRLQQIAFDDAALVPVTEEKAGVVQVMRDWVRGSWAVPNSPPLTYYYALWKE